MSLNKRYRHNIRHNFSFYFSMTLLTVLAVLMDLLFSGAVFSEKDYLNDFTNTAKCEDAQFITYKTIDDEDIPLIEEKFDTVIEKQRYMDCTVINDYTLRIFSRNQKLNGYVLTDGSNLSADNDILISSGLAQARNIKTGDKLSINGKEFNICGFFSRIDYLLMLESTGDTISDPSNFGIAVVNENVFDEFDEAEVSSYYSVCFNSDNEMDFRKYLNEQYTTASYLKAENNSRINTAPNMIERYYKLCSSILPMTLIGIIVLMSVIIGRKVKTERKQIGVLIALGYRRKEIALHYMFYGIIPGAIGSILGILLALPLVSSVGKSFFASKIEPLPITYSIDIKQLFIAVIAPMASYGFFAWLKTYHTMSKNPVDMMRNSSGDIHKNIFRMADSKKSVCTKYKLRAVFGHLSRTVVVACGMAIGGMLLVYSFVVTDSMNSYIDKSVDKAGSYNYEYFLNTIADEPVENAAEMIVGSFEYEESGSNVTLMGLDDVSYINCDLKDGGTIELSVGNFYLSSRASVEFALNKGDKLTLLDINSLEKHEITISGIVTNDTQNLIYTSRSKAAELVGIPENSYNAVMSEKSLDYSNSEIYNKVSMSELKSQIKNLTEQQSSLVYVMILFGVLIGVIVTYLMVNVLVNESASVISMLKILGYTDNEISKMTTRIYNWIVPIGIILGGFLGYGSAASNFKASVSSYHAYFEPAIKPVHLLIYVALEVISYAISLTLLSRKIRNYDAVEALKNTNE